MKKGSKVLKRILSGFLSLAIILSIIPFASFTVVAADNSLPALDYIDEYNAKSSTAIKNISNMMNASSNSAKYSALLKRAGGYAALLGGSIDAMRGAINSFDSNDEWYENIWNIGSGAVAGFLGLSSSESSTPPIQYDLAEMKSMIQDMDQDIQEINSKLDDLEETIQTNFEDLKNAIINKIQESEYKQALDEFTGDFSYYLEFKPELSKKYNELLIALEGGNEKNIKQAYDNLYIAAKKSESLYGYITGENKALTGKQTIQDILYDYSVISSAEKFELTCVEFAEDLNSTYVFAQYCLSLCYNYQLLYAQMNEQSYDAYYYVQQNDTSVENIQYASIPLEINEMLVDQNTVNKFIAKYMCKVLRLNGEFDYTSRDIRFGTVPYNEVSTSNIYGSVAHTSSNGSTVYYRTNNNIQRGDVIQICEMPDAYMSMFSPQGFSISVSNTNATLSNGVVRVIGSSGSFDIIYSYDGMECYRTSFNIVSKYSGGLGIENAPYLISSPSQFDGIRKAETQCHYLLTNDINYGGSQLQCLSIASGGFGGILDGGGYKVYNYRITSSGMYDSNSSQLNYSLFPIIKSDAVIKNLTIGNIDCASYNGFSVSYEVTYSRAGYSLNVYNGILSGINEGTISNCNIQNVRVDARITIPTDARYFWSLDAYIGGFAADNRGTIAHSVISSSSLTGRYQSGQAPCRLYIGGISGTNRRMVSTCFSQNNSILGETTASSTLMSTQSLIYGGNIIGQNGGSCQAAFGENCSVTLNPYGSHTKAKYIGVSTGAMPTSKDVNYMNTYGLMDGGNGKAVIDHNTIKEMCGLVPPHKTVYYLGEALNLTGLELYYNNKILPSTLGNISSLIKAYNFKVSGYDSTAIGTQTVTLTYNDLSTSFDVTVLCPHQWENGSETVDPTHTQYGTYTETCSLCGETKETLIDKLGDHNYSAWNSCGSEEHQKICECGDTIKEAHNWDGGLITTPATHTAVGVITYSCVDCGESKEREIPKQIEHTYDDWVTLNNEQHKKTCACGDEVVENHNWNSGVLTTPATHTVLGVMTYTCEDCEATKTEDVPKLTGHTYSSWTKLNDEQHQKVCECGNVIVENHNWDEGVPTTPATYTSDGVMTYTCDDCRATYTEIIPKLSISADTVAIVVDDASGIIGKTMDLDICLVNNPGITSMRISVNYNSELLKLTNISYNSAMGGQSVSPENYEVLNGQVILYWTDGFNDYREDGVFATLTFEVSDTAVVDEQTKISITYEADDIYDVNEDNVTFAIKSGNITFIDYLPGDINGDGVVNTKDTTRLMRYFAGWDVEVVEAALDVNGDGVANTKDTTRLMRYLADWDVSIH